MRREDFYQLWISLIGLFLAGIGCNCVGSLLVGAAAGKPLWDWIKNAD